MDEETQPILSNEKSYPAVQPDADGEKLQILSLKPLSISFNKLKVFAILLPGFWIYLMLFRFCKVTHVPNTSEIACACCRIDSNFSQ